MRLLVPFIIISLWYPSALFSQISEESSFSGESYRESLKHNKIDLHLKKSPAVKDAGILLKKINNESLLVEYVRQMWSDTGWVNEIRENVSYDDRENWIEILRDQWKDNKWESFYKYEQRYDDNNNWIEWKRYSWSDTGWANGARSEQSYDNNNNWIEWIGYTWNNNSWQSALRETQSYNSDGNWVVWFEYVWSDSGWTADLKDTVVYNQNKLWEEWTEYEQSDSGWVNYLKENQYYNNNNDWVEWFQYEWGGEWLKSYKDTIMYNSNNNWIENIEYEWNGDWLNSWRETQYYDENFFWSEWTGYEWDGMNWVYYQKENPVYDADYNIVENVLQGWGSTGWTNIKKHIYTFSTPTDITEPIPAHMDYRLENNYPNPFNPLTSIQYQISEKGFVSLKIYDVLGRELTTLVNRFQKPGIYKINFNAGNLPSGTYIYRLQVNDFSASKKLLLLR